MTKETKIGLLVGLAFIVLFAIILSEKGATPGTKAPSGLTMADAANDGDTLITAQQPLHDAGRLPVDAQLAPLVSAPPVTIEAPPMAEEPVGQLVPEDDSQIVPLPSQLVERLNLPVEDDPAPDEDDIQDAPLADAPQTLMDAVAAARHAQEEPPARAAQTARPLPNETQVSLTHTPNPTPAAPAEALVAPKTTRDTSAPPAPKKVVVQAVHEVQKGENLGKIAAKYYGRSTPARLQAILDANHGVFENINDIRPAMKLTIPVLTASGEMFEPVAGSPVEAVVAANTPSRRDDQVRIPLPVGAATTQRPRINASANKPADPSAAAASSQPPEFRWYEIRKSDSLAKIAKRELGDEHRFVEIYRLNRDRIPDKNRIRPGLKIRLPASGAIASSQSPRNPDI